jgi:HEPN domain-containing protein
VTEDAQPSAREAAKWLTKADEDLAVARVVASNAAIVNWAACYHAQQAAEKALKGVLVLLGIDFPRTHALDRLLDLVPEKPRRTFDRHRLTALSVWAVAGRYPEDIEDPTDAEVAASVSAADVALHLARALIATAEQATDPA